MIRKHKLIVEAFRHVQEKTRCRVYLRASRRHCNATGASPSEQGAATTCFAATAPELTGKGGAYLEDCKIVDLVADDPNLRGGVRDFAIDPEQADKLWAVAEEMIRQRLGH